MEVNQIKVKLSYLENKVEIVISSDDKFHSFLKKIIESLHLESITGVYDNLFIYYMYSKKEIEANSKENKEIQRKLQIKNDNDFQSMIEKIKNHKKDGEGEENIIKVETEEIPINYEKNVSGNFEEEINNVVRAGYKSLEDKLLKYFRGRFNYNLSNKIQKETCATCNQIIVGDMYKDVIAEKDIYYCEKCSRQVGPTFQIH